MFNMIIVLTSIFLFGTVISAVIEGAWTIAVSALVASIILIVVFKKHGGFDTVI